MKQAIWTREYEVSLFLVNPQGKLGLYSLLNILQDVAWAHATHLGHGYESTIARNVFWVLTRQKLVMDEWPSLGETVEVRTWVRPPESSFANRDFEIFVNGKKRGESTTSWLLLDAKTRKPLRGDMRSLGIEARTDFQLSLAVPKIEPQTGLEDLARFQVRNSDLDMNQHVNNTRYAQWILDSIPHAWHRQYQLHEYEVNFLAETKSNDVITIQKSELQPLAPATGWTQFQGLREEDEKVVFTARLNVSES